ncbi:MAG: M14 family zinc carboxypeptidase [Gammaproteobacteria bacterium]|nr:M14 family zinc carboxypeptidase [Gammaproteobacteria bacterium]
MNSPHIPICALLVLLIQAASADEVKTACEKISGKLASVSFSECDRLQLEPSGYRSVDGFPLLIKEFPPLESRQPKGRVLLVGGTHGDELSSISIVFKWMHTLEKHHSGLFHWRINPLMNPDGALRRRHIRMNANKVDLNRNFTTPQSDLGAPLVYWYGAARKNARRYPGPYPLSEPETNWLYQEIEHFKPDVIIAVHAPYSLVDYDAPSRKNAPKRIGNLHRNLMGTYPGSLGNYAGIHLGIPVITLELPHAGIMPTGKQISWLWADLVRWLIRNL